MKKLIFVLLLAGCYHMKWARFVDGSETDASAWICVPDDDPTNPKGIMCGGMGAVMEHMSPLTPPIPLLDGGSVDM